MIRRGVLIAPALLAACAVSGAAQSYRARVDVRAQAVSFRGLVSDSIEASQAVVGPTGGFETPDGHAVRCSSSPYCYYFRPGPELRGVPVTTSASVILWGFGVQGLTFRATGRLVGDLGGDDVWPGTDPAGQFLEGYLEYQRASIVARAGRVLVSSRFEPMGFDGAWLKYRWDRASLELTGYGGWGLGQAAALPVTSPALNPLDEWRPQDRQIVAGLEAAWFYRSMDVRGEYRREIDPHGYDVVSERAGLSFGAPIGPLLAAAGVEYNVAEAEVGSADLTLSYFRPRFTLSAGARRYRPYFSLWTLWSAFSPVPHNGVTGSAEVRATDWLSLRGRGEWYQYEDAEVSTGIVPELEDGGWRTSAGATATLNPHWTLDGNAGFEHGPGAAARFADGALTWTPNDRYSFDLHGGALARPLELRFYDATSLWIGGRADALFGSQHRAWVDVAFVDDERDRPDASASSMSQVRVRLGLTVSFGTAADRLPLPPGQPRRP
jgi:hypothetical protein